MRVTNTQIRRHPGERNGTIQCLNVHAMDLSGRTQTVGTEHEVTCGESFVHAEIGAVCDGGRLEAGERFFETFLSAAIPEVPSLSYQIFGFWNVDTETDLRTMGDP